MCGQSLVCFGSSVIYIEGAKEFILQPSKLLLVAGFSFDVTVVSNIADIIISIDIIINKLPTEA